MPIMSYMPRNDVSKFKGTEHDLFITVFDFAWWDWKGDMLSSAGINHRFSMRCLVCPPDKHHDQWNVLHKNERNQSYE